MDRIHQTETSLLDQRDDGLQSQATDDCSQSSDVDYIIETSDVIIQAPPTGDQQRPIQESLSPYEHLNITTQVLESRQRNTYEELNNDVWAEIFPLNGKQITPIIQLQPLSDSCPTTVTTQMHDLLSSECIGKSQIILDNYPAATAEHEVKCIPCPSSDIPRTTVTSDGVEGMPPPLTPVYLSFVDEASLYEQPYTDAMSPVPTHLNTDYSNGAVEVLSNPNSETKEHCHSNPFSRHTNLKELMTSAAAVGNEYDMINDNDVIPLSHVQLMGSEGQCAIYSRASRPLPAVSPLAIYELLNTNITNNNESNVTSRRVYIVMAKIVLLMIALAAVVITTVVITMIVLNAANDLNVGKRVDHESLLIFSMTLTVISA